MSRPSKIYLNAQSDIGTFYDWTDPANPATGTNTGVLHSRGGINLSSSHRRVNGHYIDGGSWWMMKEESIVRPSGSVAVIRAERKAYVGSFTTENAGWNPPPWWWSPSAGNTFGNDIWNQISSDAAGAYNRCKPTNPDFSLARSLFELKDVPSMLKHANKHVIDRVRGKAGNRTPSRTEEWYLAIQFGWIPLLSDIRKFVEKQASGQKRLDQLIKDEGKPIKRQTKMRNPWNAPEKEVTASFNYVHGTAYNTDMKPQLVTQCYVGGNATTDYHAETQVRTWAKGTFRYMLPPGPRNVKWTKAMKRKLLGWRVTPTDVYNVMPWTWLVDYFTNLGDFIETVDSGVADRLVSEGFYIMNSYEWRQTTTSTQFVQTGKDGASKEVSSVRTIVWTNKARWPATTFGVGVTQGDLSPYQVSILGALGKSRLT